MRIDEYITLQSSWSLKLDVFSDPVDGVKAPVVDGRTAVKVCALLPYDANLAGNKVPHGMVCLWSQQSGIQEEEKKVCAFGDTAADTEILKQRCGGSGRRDGNGAMLRDIRYSPVFGLRSIDFAVQIAPSQSSASLQPSPDGSHPTVTGEDHVLRSVVVYRWILTPDVLDGGVGGALETSFRSFNTSSGAL